MTSKKNKTDQQWQAELSDEQYYVCRQKGTERPFSGEYVDCKEAGIYQCVCCGADLFDADAKYNSGTGWPSFYQPATADAVEEEHDHSHNMLRIEVHCKSCGPHLGHVFPDGPHPTGLRYCINSVSLKHRKKDVD